MVKLFSASTLIELENKVNTFEEKKSSIYYFSEHSLSYSNGLFLMSVVMTKKDYN